MSLLKKLLKLFFIVSTFYFFSCGNETIQNTKNISQNSETRQISQNSSFSFEKLSKERRAEIDKIFSSKTREIFEKAEQIVLRTKILEKGSKKAILTNQRERNEILDLAYQNAKIISSIDCKPFYQYILEAEYDGKTALIKFDFFCGLLASDKEASIDKKKFEKIVSEIIEKYGVDVQ